MNTPASAPAIPAMTSGIVSRVRRWRRFCKTINDRSGTDTVFSIMTAVWGSSTRSRNGVATMPIPKPTVLSTVEPANAAAAAVMI